MTYERHLGSFVVMPMTSDKFWTGLDRTTTPGCWEWTGWRSNDGYGRVSSYGWFPGPTRPLVASRVAWVLANGEIPEGLSVLHRCDNPPCCNPAHLFLGTQSDNMRDAGRKGRVPGRRKLGDEVLAELRQALATEEPTVDIARRFGVSKGYAMTVARGEARGGAPIARPPVTTRANKAQKLTSDDVVAIRRRVAGGELQRVVAQDYGVQQSIVSRIVNRHRRGEDPGPPAPETNGWKKLLPREVLTIRERVASGEAHNRIAMDYGVGREAVSAIAQGRAWVEVTGGEPIQRPRLTPEQRQEIAQRLASGETQTALAAEFMVSQQTISNIKRLGR